MATLPQQNLYQCTQCGNRELTAAPVLYHEGTRTYSGMFRWGSSQSESARVSAPPRLKGYAQPFLRWGFPISFCLFWGFAILTTLFGQSHISAKTANTDAILLLVGFILLGGLFLDLRRIARYNRDVYPNLFWKWQHTYMCHRCGTYSLITP